MADPFNDQVRSLEDLIDALERAQIGLERTGKSAEEVIELINKLKDAIAGSIDVVPSVNELTEAISRVKDGLGGVVNLGASFGNIPFNEAARGFKEWAKLVGPQQLKNTQALAKDIQNLSEVNLSSLAEELKSITGEEITTEQINSFAKFLSELEGTSGLSRVQFDQIDDYQDALIQVKTAWEKINLAIEQLSSEQVSRLAEEFKEISGTDLPVEELEKLFSVVGKAANSAVIDVKELSLALKTLEESGEVDVAIPDKINLDTPIELIRELEESVSRLSDIDLSKLSKEYSKLTGVVDFPVENIKAFVENIRGLLQTGHAFEERVTTIQELAKALDSLRVSGEIPRSLKVIGDEIKSLSDVDLSRLGGELEQLTKLRFSKEDILEWADELSNFELIPGQEDLLKDLEEALSVIKDKSQLTIREIKNLGNAILNLEEINLERISLEFERIAKSDFPVDNIKDFATLLSEIESRDIIKPGTLTTINNLGDALAAVQSEQSLPFEKFTDSLNKSALSFDEITKKFGGYEEHLNRAVEKGKEFDQVIQYLIDNLGALGLSSDEIKVIVDHFKELERIESPARFIEELSQINLPDEELKRFALGLAALRNNTELIANYLDVLRFDIKISDAGIDELEEILINLGVPLEKLNASAGVTKKGIESLLTSMKTERGTPIRFSREIDSLTGSLIPLEEELEEIVPAIERFQQVLETQGVEPLKAGEVSRKVFSDPSQGGLGATDFSKPRITETKDDLLKFTTTLQQGEEATRTYTLYLNDLGNAFENVGDAIQENPLDDLVSGLQSFDIPDSVIDQITGQLGEDQTLSAPRIKEVNDEITQLTGTIQAAGGVQKAYLVYWDQTGEVLKSLPIEETTVSIQDFHEQLSGRVGAIDNVNKMLEKYGFNVSQLKNMTTEASTGITKLEFAMKSQGGATQKLTLHVTEFGKVLTDTQRRFRTFAGGIARNVGESFKWAVAITAVYGPLRKLQDLVQISIDNESKLADVGVVLGKNTAELQNIFSDAVKAAKATGESLNGVIEGYSLAYRATGNLATETERTAVANQLLIDSLVLSKLSTLDQAEAMDTLVAGLLQAGYNLDQGAELLNKWVAVSKAANVTVDTLATSFAIMATAAEGVGLSFDELNAIVAVVAANTELSAKQAGNAVRAFVSGFQTTNAREELAKFGIAVEDLNGDARDFMSVMYDIKELMDAGLIDEAELNRIGTALGGRGARRGAQFTTFLKSLDEVQGLVTVSAKAQADAYDALEIKMDTVQTSLTNLSTSFQQLANTMGTEGGVLDLLKIFVDTLDKVVDSVGSFISVMGKAGPLLIAGGGLLAYGQNTGRLRQFPGQLGNFATNALSRTAFGRTIRSNPEPMPISDYQNYSIYGKTMAQSFGGWVTNNAAAMGSIMGQGIMAIMNVADKDWDGLGGQIAGGILGAPFGPLGSLIGATAGEALVNSVVAAGQSGELKDAFKGVFAEAEPPEGNEEDDLTREQRLLERQEKLNNQLRDTVSGDWIAGIDLFKKNADNFLADLFGVPKKWQEDLTATQVLGGQLQEVVRGFDTGGVSGARTAARTAQFAGITDLISDEDVKQKVEGYRQLLAAIEANVDALDKLAKGEEPEGTVLKGELSRNMEEYGDLLKSEIKVAQEEFNKELIDGDLTIKQYNESMERMGQEGESILRVFTAMTPILGDSEDALLDVLHVVSRTSSEEINIITNLTSGISDLKDQIRDLNAEGDITLAGIKTEELEQATFQLEQVFNQIREAQRQPLLEDIFNAPTEVDFAPDEYDLVKEEALRIMQERINEYVRLGLIPDDTTIQEVIESGTLIGVAFGEAFGAAMRGEVDVLVNLFDEAAENLRLDEEIKPARPEPSRFRIQEVDMTQAAFEASYNRQLAFLKEAFGQYWQPSLETVGLIFKDGTDVLHLDNLAMQLAMNDLIDVNQKQLEGVYNLPADSSFYVPFQGYKLGFDDSTGGGAAASALSGSADELDQAARDLMDAALALAEDTYSPELPKEIGDSVGEEFNRFAFQEPMALIGGEKYPKEYGPERRTPLLGGEKYLEEYGPPAPDYGEALIGGEKYLNEYDTAVTNFETGVSEFGQYVRDFGAQLENEMEISRTAQAEDPYAGRIITRAPQIEDIQPRSGLPGAEQANSFVSIVQQFANELVTQSFGFWQQFISGSGGENPAYFGVGSGGGIGPEPSFSKLDSAADKLSNFADIMQPAYEYTVFGPSQPVGASDTASDFSGMLDLLNQKISNLSGFTTNLKISSNYTANLIVDGRTLAQVIKPYLYTDMIRFEDTASTVTKSIVA